MLNNCLKTPKQLVNQLVKQLVEQLVEQLFKNYKKTRIASCWVGPPSVLVLGTADRVFSGLAPSGTSCYPMMVETIH